MICPFDPDGDHTPCGGCLEQVCTVCPPPIREKYPCPHRDLCWQCRSKCARCAEEGLEDERN